LSPDVQTTAVGQFFYQWTNLKGCFDYVLPLHKNSSGGGFINDIVECIGLAYMSRTGSNPTLMLEASAKHTVVLRAVNTALRDMTTAKNDETLVAVLLLGLFEVIL
jgi:hypothetical protein